MKAKFITLDDYEVISKDHPYICAFSQYWWITSISSKHNWRIIAIEHEGLIIAIMPLYFKTKFGLILISMPKLTQTLGPSILKTNFTNRNLLKDKVGFENKIYKLMIDAIPKYHFFIQNFNVEVTNWLPFFWRSFSQTTRYTYVIRNVNIIDDIKILFDYSKRKAISRAEKSLNIIYDYEPSAFYDHHFKSLKERNIKISYTKDEFISIYNAGKKNNTAHILGAVDSNNNVHAALFLITDSETMYNVISTVMPCYKNSGASALVVYEAIKLSKTKVQNFDFEGSMNEGIELSFRQFGGVQIPFFTIYSYSNRFLKFLHLI